MANVYFTDEQKAVIIETIVDDLSSGIPLSKICRTEGFPSVSAIWRWCDADPALAQRVARAREDGTHALAEMVLEISFDERFDWKMTQKGLLTNEVAISRARLQTENILKLLACWNPKAYGQKIQVDQTLTVKESPLAQLRALEMRRAEGRTLEAEEIPISPALPGFTLRDEDLF